MMPVRSRAMDDVHGCTNVAGGMDAGSDRPVCEPLQESQTSKHVCAVIGGALFGYFLVLSQFCLEQNWTAFGCPKGEGHGWSSSKSIATAP